MKNIIKWVKENKAKTFLMTFIIVLAVFGVPKLIDWSYFYYNGEPNTTFSSKDLLAFWGALVGGTIVLLGVFITIRYSDKKAKEAIRKSEYDRARRVKPTLSSQYTQVYSKKFIEESEGREEFVIVNLNDEVNPMYSSPTAPTWLDFSRTKDNTSDTFLVLDNMRKYLCISYVLTNYGGDTALDIEMLMNGSPVAPNFSLGKHHCIFFKFVFAFERMMYGEEKEISIQYRFTNIDSSIRYIAKESFTVFKDSDGGLSSKQHPNDFLGTKEVQE